MMFKLQKKHLIIQQDKPMLKWRRWGKFNFVAGVFFMDGFKEFFTLTNPILCYNNSESLKRV